MRLIKSLLCVFTLLLGIAAAAMAAPVTYSFQEVDNTGTLVPGATVAIGSTTLTSNTTTTLTATSVPTTAGELVLGTRAQPSGAPSFTLIDYGTGGYTITYDPATYGELIVPLTVTASGHTFTPATTIVTLTADSSLVGLINTNTVNDLTAAARVTTGIPNAAPAASGGLPTVGTGTGQVSPSGGTFTGVGLAATQTGVTIPTVTNVTNAVVASSVTGSVGSISGITFPGNFGTFSIDSSGRVTLIPGQAVGSVTSAVTLPANAPSTFDANETTTQAIYNQTTAAAQAADTQTGLTAQGLTPAVVTALGVDNTDIPLIYAKNPAYTPLVNSSGYVTATNGGGGGGSDPWATALPGSYAAGTAGYIVGNNLNAPIAGIAASVWNGSGVSVNISAAQSSSGSGFTLSMRQWLLVWSAIEAGDETNTSITANSTVTVDFYLPGAAKTTLVAVSSPTEDANGNITGRTLVFQASDATL